MATRLESHETIRLLAASQLGMVARHQLIAGRVGAGLIKHWHQTGRLVPVFPRVYALGRPAAGHRETWMAAVLAGGSEAVLAGRSAAAAFGFMKPSNRIEVCRPGGRPLDLNGLGPHHPLGVTVRTRSLERADRTWIGAIPICSVPRVMIELTGDLTAAGFRPVFIEAGRLGYLGRACLDVCLNRCGSFRGAENLRRLIEAWGPDTGRIRSVLEGEFRLLCGEFRIPRPGTNQWLLGYEVDCLWLREGVIVELDGRRFHDDAAAFERDRIKGNVLTAAGFTVIRITWGMLKRDRAEVAGLVLAALERGAARAVA